MIEKLNGKSNKWMISTIALGGVIIGIGIGLGASQLSFMKSKTLAANATQQDQQAVQDAVAKQQNQPAAPVVIPEVTAADWSRGAATPKITFVEYSDPECPFCKRFHTTLQQMLKMYPNDVRWVYRHYPIDSNHAKARKEAEALECAGSIGGQDKFWAYLDRLMEITPGNDGLDPAELPKIADTVGVDKDTFAKCLASGKSAQKIEAQVQDAEKAGADGTPHTIIITADGKRYPLKGYVDVTQLSKALQPFLK